MARKRKPFKLGVKDGIIFILFPFLAGLIISAFIPKPVIAVIEIKDPIEEAVSTAAMKQIEYALRHWEVRAVVLKLNSPGGTISDTELVYMELNRLRRYKPVVTMVESLSASGSYYISMASDYIISNPSAMVGNVGVIGYLPNTPIIFEDIVSTGPYKLWGASGDSYIRQIDMMKKGFLEAVLHGRGDRLKVTGEQLLRGELLPASEALRMGLIDAIGPYSLALDEAAARAHISNFSVLDTAKAVKSEEKAAASSFFVIDENGNTTGLPRVPGIYYLYLPDYAGAQP